MKKNINKAVVLFATFFSLVSCSDFLETSSPSISDSDFVFSNRFTMRAALDAAYRNWGRVCDVDVFGDGLFYATEIAGSDIERHPESFSSQLQRHYPETLYQNGTYAGSYALLSYQSEDGAYASLFSVITKANALISSLQKKPDFDQEILNAKEPTEWTQMYGEAVALRATAYRELIRYWGDVPYNEKFGQTAKGLVPRDSIYDCVIADLLKVEPLMYKVGEIPGVNPTAKNYFSKTFVQGLIGRLALEAAGFQTRRNDIQYKDGKGNIISFEKKGTDNNDAFYGRRSDYKELYSIAKGAYERLLSATGSAKFHLTDPRGASDKKGRCFNNPYQYFFDQMMSADVVYADESIYEYPLQQGVDGATRPYASGRPSNGGNKAYPCKSYTQARFNPAFYYGIFNPLDMRRDVSITVTGSTGKGVEKLIPFEPNSKAAGGGLALNKWDENRQKNPWIQKMRRSGINGPYMRMSEIYLSYAEACAVLGDEPTARQYLAAIRERSFPKGKANTDEFIAKCGGMFKAIIEERGFEFAGEGDRRWTLVRTGLLPEAIKRTKDLTRKMLDGLKSVGYYTFENGNTISNYVWTKLVDARTVYGHRLTAQCPEDKLDDPVMYPSWRGQKDDWEAYGLDYGTDTPKTNLAIKGLFNHIAPGSKEALALEADGYIMEKWGQDLVDNDDEYYKYFFYDYDYVKAPIYLWPFTPNVMLSGGFNNGYGFSQK